MNRMTLVNTILYLYPEAKFTVWETNDLKHYHGEDNPIPINNMLIDWSKLNPYACPSMDSILKVDQSLVSANEEKKRKMTRDASYKNDVTMKAALQIYQVSNPTATLSNYLDYLETIQI